VNSRLILAIVGATIAGIIGLVTFSGSQFINDISKDGLGKLSPAPIEVIPLQIELANLSVIEVTDEQATIQVDFRVTDLNYKSIILQLIKYELYENGVRITTEEIGQRPEGMVDVSNYFTILSNSPQIIGEKITIRNTGNMPEFWSALTNNTAKWTVKGEAYYNLSSMTSGHENITPFEFTR
jgi:LEA14-like dessication related protein